MAACDNFILLQFLVVLACSMRTIICEIDVDQIQVAECDVKPGGAVHNCVQKWEDFQCTFTYVAQGGTNEHWTLGISRDKEQRHYSCVVERPSGTSYLFFQQFKMEVEGVEITDVTVENNSGALADSEYKVDKNKGVVEHVEGKFTSMLSRIKVMGKVGSKEL